MTRRHAPSREDGSPRGDRAAKPCAVCGRAITWRKKWERDWGNVRYCSDACRRHKPGETDAALERAILGLLGARGPSCSICPSEAARAVDAQGWERLMEPVRRAARRLAARGLVEFTQGGRPVDPSTARGPVRLRTTRAAPGA